MTDVEEYLAKKVTETMLLNAWLRTRSPDIMPWKRVRVGVDVDYKKKEAYKVLKRYVDCIFIEKDILYIVEAKLKPKADAIGQLEFYEKLLLETPEFRKFMDLPIKKIFITLQDDASVREFAVSKQIEMIVFKMP